ncbi:hypothetical protein ALP79_200066 [Pseudomonas savastanoi pv. fraxini]|nr:hypothetical protein ALP79_200066 [Pseudomonas savastanoi pv. fraxini]
MQVQQLCWTGGIDKQLERVCADMCCPELKIALSVTHLLQQCVSAWQMLLKILTRAAQIDFASPFVAIFPGLCGLFSRGAAVTCFDRFAHVQAFEHVRQQQKISGNVAAADLCLFKDALLEVRFDLAQVLVRASRITAHRRWQFLRVALGTAQSGDSLGDLDLVFVLGLPVAKSRLISGQLHAQIIENGQRVIKGDEQGTVLIVDAALPKNISTQWCP